MGQVSGQVTLNGQKIGGAQISFVSANSAEDQFSGATSRDGTYHVTYRMLEGMPVGRYTIRISIDTLPDGTPFPPGKKAEELKEEGKLVQNTYVFEQDITAGMNAVDFALEQGKKETLAKSP